MIVIDMQIDQQLLDLYTGKSPQQRQMYDKSWGAYKPIMDAWRQSQQTRPGQPGIMYPEQEPENTPIIDPNNLMMMQGSKQSMEQPDYLPPIPEDMNVPDREKLFNMLRLLENYHIWKKGENP